MHFCIALCATFYAQPGDEIPSTNTHAPRSSPLHVVPCMRLLLSTIRQTEKTKFRRPIFFNPFSCFMPFIAVSSVTTFDYDRIQGHKGADLDFNDTDAAADHT